MANFKKKSVITSTNADCIKKGFSNKFGMVISNNPEVRNEVANYAKSLISKLHEERKLGLI